MNNEQKTLLTSDELTAITINSYGDMTTVKPDIFINMFNLYIKINQRNIDKAVTAMYADYDSLDNNSVTTETTTSTFGSVTPSAVTTTTKEKTIDNSNLILTGENSTSATTGNSNTETVYREYKHGNISATTNQSIIEQEYELRLQNYILQLVEKAVYFGGVYYEN